MSQGVFERRERRTRSCWPVIRQLTAVSLKKGDFTTPSVDPIFQKENGGLKYDISKPPLDFSTQNRHRMAVSCVRIYTLNSYLSLE